MTATKKKEIKEKEKIEKTDFPEKAKTKSKAAWMESLLKAGEKK